MSTNSFLKDMVKLTNNEYACIADEGVESGDVSGFIDTGVYALNALLSGSLYGGLPANKITALAGESATGKTEFTLCLLRQFLDSNKDAVCMYFESEGAITREMFVARGIDPKRVAVVSVTTVEEFRHQAIKVVDNYLKMSKADRKPMMIVLDSLGMLSSTKEMEDTAEGKGTRDMTRAQITKATFRVLTMRLARAGIPMIFTNHVYNTQGSMYPQKVMSGGEALRYAASTVLFLSKRKEKDSENQVVGNVIHCNLYKGRFTKENSMVDVLLRYDTGLNKYYGLLPLAEKYEIFKKVSTRYEMPDGSKAFEKNILENPEKYYTNDVMKKLEDCVAKEFKYGNTIVKTDNTNEPID